MDNPISSSIVMAFKVAIEKTQMSRETKEKVDTIVNMAAASAESIAKSVGIDFDVLLGILGSELMNKSTEDYKERSEDCAETKAIGREEAE